ncbi:hypothetical protein BDW74DRAFT_171396 [Aspergillus multicolor]|uniref:uncharacterized protein n=1 Tax=Aspergillus multicolor TaxID=41759 RepID=UPI003CCE517B
MNGSKPVPNPRTYDTLSKTLLFPNLEEKEWWEATGPMLSKMLADANYDIHHQFHYLNLWAAHIIPFLGPFPKSRPGLYKCALGGLGSMEFSQNFTKAGATVRLTFEPTSYAASTGQDLCNRGMVDEALRRLKRVSPAVDLTLYHELLCKLTLTDADEKALVDRNAVADQAVKTQTMLALDMKGGEIAAKLYLVPALKSLATGTPMWTLLRDAVRALDASTGGIFAQGLSNVESYIANAPPSLHADMLSCDLVAPTKTRFKIYVSEFDVNFDRVVDLWTLGGKIQSDETQQGLNILKGIWDVLDIQTGLRPPPDLNRPSPTLPPDELPIVVNLEIKPGGVYPQPKMYFALPGQNSLEVATAVEGVFRSWGWEEHADNYIRNLQSYKPDVALEESSNVFSWLSFSYSTKTGPYVTLYYH